jgi:hypothetical protein
VGTAITFRNRVDRITLGIGVFGAAVGVSVGLAYGTFGTIMLSTILGAAWLAAYGYATIGRTPKSVTVDSEAITLHSYWGSVKRIAFDQIEYLVINPPDPPSWRKKYLQGGWGKPVNGRVFIFTREIGQAIREGYHNKLGDYPPDELHAQV